LERLSLLAAWIASDGTDLVLLRQVWVSQHMIHNRTTLVARGSEDGEYLGHPER
jgi:hypothetical protein